LFFSLALEGFSRGGGMSIGGIEFVREYAEIVLGSTVPGDGPEGPASAEDLEILRKEKLVRAPEPEGFPIASAEEFVRSRYAKPVFRRMQTTGFPVEAREPETSKGFLALVDDLFFRPIASAKRKRTDQARKKRRSSLAIRRKNRGR